MDRLDPTFHFDAVPDRRDPDWQALDADPDPAKADPDPQHDTKLRENKTKEKNGNKDR